MSFSLAQIIGKEKALQVREHASEPDFVCPTGKKPFATKDDAYYVARHTNKRERNRMRVFRCGFCEHYHLGHNRGAIL